MTDAIDSTQANVSIANVKLRISDRSQIGTGTSEFRRRLIGRELFEEKR